jgi:hypothetical protein
MLSSSDDPFNDPNFRRWQLKRPEERGTFEKGEPILLRALARPGLKNRVVMLNATSACRSDVVAVMGVRRRICI